MSHPTRITLAFTLVCLTFGLLAASTGTASAVSSIGISAGTFRFNTPSGRTLKGDLYVSNEGDTPIHVLVYTADLIQTPKGAALFTTPSRGLQPTSNSPASWTSIRAPDSTRIINNSPYLRLGVRTQSHVFFEIDVPPKVPPGDYTMVIFFEMFNVGGAAKGSTSSIGGRVGSRVQVRVQGKINEKVSVRPFKIGTFVFGTRLPYGFSVRNDGNIDHHISSTIELLTTDEEVKQKAVIAKDEYVYAGKRRDYGGGIELKEFGLGKYIAELHTSYMKESSDAKGKVTRAPDEIVKQRVFYVIPWSLVVPAAVILLVILMLIGIFVARRRRGPAPAQPVPPSERPPPPEGPGPGGGWQPEPPHPQPVVQHPVAEPIREEPGSVTTVAEKAPQPADMEESDLGQVEREEPEEETVLADEPSAEPTPGPAAAAEEAPETAAQAGEGEREESSERRSWKRSWGKPVHYGPEKPPGGNGQDQ